MWGRWVLLAIFITWTTVSIVDIIKNIKNMENTYPLTIVYLVIMAAVVIIAATLNF